MGTPSGFIPGCDELRASALRHIVRRNKHVPENRADRGKVPASAAKVVSRQSGFLFRGSGSGPSLSMRPPQAGQS
jgi:hypothetical protein